MSFELLGVIAVAASTGVYYIWKYSDPMPRICWLIVGISLICWVWLLAAIFMPPRVIKTSYYYVIPRIQQDGRVVDTIVVDGKPVNVNEILGCHPPVGAKIKRIEYKDSILGLKLYRSPRYEY